LAALAFRYDEFVEAGGEVLIISPDSVEQIREFLTKTNEGPGRGELEELPFPVLFDEAAETQKRWAVWHVETFQDKEYPQPIASTFVVDKEGVIRFKHVAQGGVAHGDRPDVDILLAVVRHLSAPAR
jgi:peroxiredoxin